MALWPGLATVGAEPDTVAENEDDYIRIALELVSNPESLQVRRAALRDAVRRSPLCDLDGFASDFLTAMKTIAGR